MVVYTQLVANAMFEILKEGIVMSVNFSGKHHRTEVVVPLISRHVIVPIRVVDGSGKGSQVQTSGQGQIVERK